MIGRIREVFQYNDMIRSLVLRELRGKYKGSILGFLWTFINPLCQIVVYIMVFSHIFRSGIEQYPVYLITGMFPWIFFSGAIQQSTYCIRSQSEMVKKIYFPREVLPIVCVTFNFINMLFCFVIVFLTIGGFRWGINWRALLFLPLVMLIEYVFTLGVSLILSAITVYFRDVEHIVSVILMALIYLTPVMYRTDMLSGKLKVLFMCNPLTPLIENYHNILYDKIYPSCSNLIISGTLAIALLIVGELIFIKLEANFAEEM